jgi:hypothetical protein
VREWAGAVVDLLAEARTRCEHDAIPDPGTSSRTSADLEARASALLDSGRFFFRNIVGRYRPPILDVVMLSYLLIPRIHEDIGVNKRISLALHWLQITFVNAIRTATDFSKVPATVEEYEQYLYDLPVPNVSEAIRALATERRRHGFQIHFDDIPLDNEHLPNRWGPQASVTMR